MLPAVGWLNAIPKARYGRSSALVIAINTTLISMQRGTCLCTTPIWSGMLEHLGTDRPGLSMPVRGASLAGEAVRLVGRLTTSIAFHRWSISVLALPVGVSFGYGAKFPDRYQRALYICDWTFGTIYAIHMEPDGSTYRAVKEEFLSRSPLPLTDALVGKDGAFYFTVGGRGTQSELYRVTYKGNESIAPVDPRFEQGAELRKLRREIEAWHRDTHSDSSVPVDFLVKHLGHSDPYIRYAARIALERIDETRWWSDATRNASIDGLLQACLGAARSGAVARKNDIYKILEQANWSSLTTSQQRDYLRTLEVVMIRLGKPAAAASEAWIRKLEGMFPSEDSRVNRELCALLVALDSPRVPAMFVPLLEKKSAQDVDVAKELLERNRGYGSSIASMLANQPDLQQMHYAFVLREQKSGWTPALRRAYFEWFKKAQGWSGGNSYQKFLTNISNDAYSHCTDVERLSIEALGLRTPAFVAKEIPKAKGPGKEYSIDEVSTAVDRGLQAETLRTESGCMLRRNASSVTDSRVRAVPRDPI